MDTSELNLKQAKQSVIDAIGEKHWLVSVGIGWVGSTGDTGVIVSVLKDCELEAIELINKLRLDVDVVVRTSEPIVAF